MPRLSSRLFLCAFVPLILAGCAATTCPCGKHAGARLAPQVTYKCADGKHLKVAYVSGPIDYVTVNPPVDTPFSDIDGLINLPLQKGVQGFVYSNGVTSLRGRGNEVYWQIDPLTPHVRCSQRLD
jgi:hypothetical protein